MIDVRWASEPVPGGGPNEDCVFAVPGLAGVLDGVTVVPGMQTGCLHGPSWYVRMLAGRLIAAHAVAPVAALADLLGTAIGEVCEAHRDSCDLTHPGTPASTACLVRYDDESLDYLVLADSPLVYEQGGRVEVVDDDRPQRVSARLREMVPADLPIGSPEHAEAVRRRITAQHTRINTGDGYWVASVDPQAGWHALSGRLPLAGPDAAPRVCLLSDGASRAVESFGLYDWRGLLDAVTGHGPAHLIARVRAAERAEHHPDHLKRHDDASAALLRFAAT